jgi:3-deoxy-D-manno-octulosonic-acid transferase
MRLLYTISIHFFGFVIRAASLFDPKARLWLRGRKGQFSRLPGALQEKGISREVPLIWFHCASLGEFEQGRPVLERFREAYPVCRILLTFFSPSGFEVRKDYPGADIVEYLPLDTPARAARFVNLVHPSLVFFVKYEYWFNFIREIHRNSIPLFIISAVFHPRQQFFRWYGGWFRKQLKQVTWFFLQDAGSKVLADSMGLRNFTVAGDTRFDRVSTIAENAAPVPVAEAFSAGKPVFIGGSTWPADEDLILPLMVNRRLNLKFIIVPHEVHEARILALMERIRSLKGFPKGTMAVMRMSQATEKQAAKAKVLVVDSIGQLSRLYRYSRIAFIGGGFGAGIHNILEAAAFGVPVVFGPNYRKFAEAQELIRLGGAVSVSDAAALRDYVKTLVTDPVHYRHVADTCRIFVQSGRGVTSRIMESIRVYGFMPRMGKNDS